MFLFQNLKTLGSMLDLLYVEVKPDLWTSTNTVNLCQSWSSVTTKYSIYRLLSNKPEHSLWSRAASALNNPRVIYSVLMFFVCFLKSPQWTLKPPDHTDEQGPGDILLTELSQRHCALCWAGLGCDADEITVLVQTGSNTMGRIPLP